MNVINTKTDLYYPEFDEKNSTSEDQYLCWSLGPQVIKGFYQLKNPKSQLIATELKDKKTNVDLFFNIVHNLSLVQMGFLLNSDKFSVVFDENYFFSKLKFGSVESIKKLAPKLVTMPFNFLNWLHQKAIAAQDLAPLHALDVERLHSYFEPILMARPSKTEGIQILELLVDLILLEKSESLLQEALKGPTANLVLKNLKELRYPQTAARDQQQAQNQLNWPGQVTAKFQRRGDRSGYDLHFFASHPSELKKTLQQLEKVAEEWKSQSQNL